MTTSANIVIVCGISTGIPVLFPTPGQITHVLLTRAPLYSGSCPPFLARLACVRHAASVDSEPGSNSQYNLMFELAFNCSRLDQKISTKNFRVRFRIFKEPKRLSGLKLGVKKTASKISAVSLPPRTGDNLSLGTSSEYTDSA